MFESKSVTESSVIETGTWYQDAAAPELEVRAYEVGTTATLPLPTIAPISNELNTLTKGERDSKKRERGNSEQRENADATEDASRDAHTQASTNSKSKSITSLGTEDLTRSELMQLVTSQAINSDCTT